MNSETMARFYLPVFLATALAIADAQACSAAGSEGGVPVYRVGDGCDCETIQEAIDAIPPLTEGIVRIRTGSYAESLFVGNRSVALIGGHGNCSVDTPDPEGRSENSGGATTPALVFQVIDDTQQLMLARMDLTGGVGINPDVAPGGGLNVWSAAGANAEVTLVNSTVYANHSVYAGGGIALVGDGEGTLILLGNSQIHSNTVAGENPRGGGLFCQGHYEVGMLGGAIAGNTVGVPGGKNFGRGGGMYLEGCSLTWYSHNSTEAPGDDASLSDNTAHGNGGGLYATGGADVALIGADSTTDPDPPSSRPLRLSGNHALFDTASPLLGRGGAIVAEGAGTQVRIDRGWIVGNHASSMGGAIFANDGATVEVHRDPDVSPCHHRRGCSVIRDNTAGLGASVAMLTAGTTDGTEVNINHTRVEDNPIIGPEAGPMFAAFSGTTLQLADSLVGGDPGNVSHAIAAGSGGLGASSTATVRIWRSTLADLNPDSAVFFLAGDLALDLSASIIHEANDHDMVEVDAEASVMATSHCMVWHDDALADLGGSSETEVSDPLFVDRTGGNYYLLPDSPAINFCQFPPPGNNRDLDWNPRGVCHSTEESCNGHVFDLGAFELQLSIFSDRFEAP